MNQKKPYEMALQIKEVLSVATVKGKLSDVLTIIAMRDAEEVDHEMIQKYILFFLLEGWVWNGNFKLPSTSSIATKIEEGLGHGIMESEQMIPFPDSIKDFAGTILETLEELEQCFSDLDGMVLSLVAKVETFELDGYRKQLLLVCCVKALINLYDDGLYLQDTLHIESVVFDMICKLDSLADGPLVAPDYSKWKRLFHKFGLHQDIGFNVACFGQQWTESYLL